MTMAQDPQAAKYQGMPRSAIAAGVVDVVKPAGQMSEPLLSYTRSLTRPVLPLPESDASQTLRKIFILLRDRTGNDFALYKANTIQRRIERRMNVHQIENLKSYLRFVLANPHELDVLFQELLIGVTSFFRDPQAFEALEQKVLPALVEGKPEGATLRVGGRLFHGRGSLFLAILIREYLTERSFASRCKYLRRISTAGPLKRHAPASIRSASPGTSRRSGSNGSLRGKTAVTESRRRFEIWWCLRRITF